MKKAKMITLTLVTFVAIGAAFSFRTAGQKSVITYYTGQDCTGSTFTPSTTCADVTGTFCYSQNDGSGCVNEFKL